MTATMTQAFRRTPATQQTFDSSERPTAVASVTKALQLLDTFRSCGPTMGVSELARLAGIPKSTAFRLLAHLEEGGFIEREGTNYRLSWRMFELGNSITHCRPRGLREIALPHLSDLYVRTRCVVHLAVLENESVVYLDKIHGPSNISVPTTVGGRMPAASCALGKVLLAFGDGAATRRALEVGLKRLTPYTLFEPRRLLNELATIRDQRIAFDREEVALGLTCVAAPIVMDGNVVAAVSVSSQTAQFNAPAIVAHVRRTAAAISRDYQLVVSRDAIAG